ncbi:hypothetical protein AB1Y20_019344 [Prymnesium parvum]|uniref:DNA repair metallo-beta-lactamase domain-containing protein n=1 Tax=Prymnesium parvum TaxID=97485 RepID=A0AB34JS71_PRYPA
MGHLRLDRLKALLKVEGSRYDSLVAFRPSGWCLPRHGGRSGGIARAGAVRLHEVPYSEHSSFTELISCVRDLRAGKIIPTVNTNSSGKADAMVQMLLQHSSRGAK